MKEEVVKRRKWLEGEEAGRGGIPEKKGESRKCFNISCLIVTAGQRVIIRPTAANHKLGLAGRRRESRFDIRRSRIPVASVCPDSLIRTCTVYRLDKDFVYISKQMIKIHRYTGGEVRVAQSVGEHAQGWEKSMCTQTKRSEEKKRRKNKKGREEKKLGRPSRGGKVERILNLEANNDKEKRG